MAVEYGMFAEYFSLTRKFTDEVNISGDVARKVGTHLVVPLESSHGGKDNTQKFSVKSTWCSGCGLEKNLISLCLSKGN